MKITRLRCAQCGKNFGWFDMSKVYGNVDYLVKYSVIVGGERAEAPLFCTLNCFEQYNKDLEKDSKID